MDNTVFVLTLNDMVGLAVLAAFVLVLVLFLAWTGVQSLWFRVKKALRKKDT